MKGLVLPVILAATFAFLLAPIVVVVISSFSAVGVFSFPPRAFTTRWYAQIDPGFYTAAYVSLIVAVITVTIAILVGVPERWRSRAGAFPDAMPSMRSACPR